MSGSRWADGGPAGTGLGLRKKEPRALRGCRQGGQGRSQAKGGSPVGWGPPCSQQAGDPQSGHSCGLGSPKAEGSSSVAGQVSTRPGRADTPETPEA